jgi:hypothetical protein
MTPPDDPDHLDAVAYDVGRVTPRSTYRHIAAHREGAMSPQPMKVR